MRCCAPPARTSSRSTSSRRAYTDAGRLGRGPESSATRCAASTPCCTRRRCTSRSRHAHAPGFVDTNVTGTLNLLEEAVAAGVGRFVFTSTTSAFGRALVPPPGAPAAWITEDVGPVPKNIYGVTKTAAEDLCELVHRNQGLPCRDPAHVALLPRGRRPRRRRTAFADANLKVNECSTGASTSRMSSSAHLRRSSAPRRSGSAATSSAPRRPSPRGPGGAAPRRARRGRPPRARLRELYDRLGWRMFRRDRARVRQRRARAAELGWEPRTTSRMRSSGSRRARTGARRWRMRSAPRAITSSRPGSTPCADRAHGCSMPIVVEILAPDGRVIASVSLPARETFWSDGAFTPGPGFPAYADFFRDLEASSGALTRRPARRKWRPRHARGAVDRAQPPPHPSSAACPAGSTTSGCCSTATAHGCAATGARRTTRVGRATRRAGGAHGRGRRRARTAARTYMPLLIAEIRRVRGHT